MTRYARSGNTQKHKKMPEDATPWEELSKPQMNSSKNTQRQGIFKNRKRQNQAGRSKFENPTKHSLKLSLKNGSSTRSTNFNVSFTNASLSWDSQVRLEISTKARPNEKESDDLNQNALKLNASDGEMAPDDRQMGGNQKFESSFALQGKPQEKLSKNEQKITNGVNVTQAKPSGGILTKSQKRRIRQKRLMQTKTQQQAMEDKIPNETSSQKSFEKSKKKKFKLRDKLRKNVTQNEDEIGENSFSNSIVESNDISEDETCASDTQLLLKPDKKRKLKLKNEMKLKKKKKLNEIQGHKIKTGTFGEGFETFRSISTENSDFSENEMFLSDKQPLLKSEKKRKLKLKIEKKSKKMKLNKKRENSEKKEFFRESHEASFTTANTDNSDISENEASSSDMKKLLKLNKNKKLNLKKEKKLKKIRLNEEDENGFVKGCEVSSNIKAEENDNFYSLKQPLLKKSKKKNKLKLIEVEIENNVKAESSDERDVNENENSQSDNQPLLKTDKKKKSKAKKKKSKDIIKKEPLESNENEKFVKHEGAMTISYQNRRKLYMLKNKLLEKGLSKLKIEKILANAKEKFEDRNRKKLHDRPCFNCRQGGHLLADCPVALGSSKQETGICFKCGSTEHSAFKCPKKISGYPFAKCFVCQEEGHISRDCPKNDHGIYVKGGQCSLCGNVNHLKKDCPTLKPKEEDAITAYTITDASSVDAEIVDDKPVKKTKQETKKIVKF